MTRSGLTWPGPAGSEWRVRARALVLGLCCLQGCTQPPVDSRIRRIQELEDKVAAQGRLIADQERQIDEQARTIRQLRTGAGAEDADQLVRVGKVELEGLSGGYDDDNDGVMDGVVLYLRVRDTDGEIIKAAGGLSVRLYDLSLPEGRQLLVNASFTPEQLSERWFGRFMTSHYTIKFPFGEMAAQPKGKSLSVVLKFNELLTGRIFEAQQIVALS